MLSDLKTVVLRCLNLWFRLQEGLVLCCFLIGLAYASQAICLSASFLFPHQIDWAVLGFIENASQIFANDAQSHQLQSAEE